MTTSAESEHDPGRESGRHAHAGGGHGHAHVDVRTGNRRRLTAVLVLASLYTGVEIGGGLWTGSLALLADAFHLLSDVAALGISLFAAWMVSRPAPERRTFGMSRAEILAALANGVGLAVMAIMVSLHAFERFGQPTHVYGPGVIAFGLGALAYEGVSLWILSSGDGENLNMRGAWLHVLSDALGSLGAILSGLSIWLWDFTWADPIASLLISGLVLHAAWWLVRDAVDVLMETAPAHVDLARIRDLLTDLVPVQSVHDLHVWSIGSGEVSLSCHLLVDSASDSQKTLARAREILRSEFGIDHTTIQIEGDPAEGHPEDDPRCEGSCE